MKKILSPEKYPLGKWPSEYTPVLMQQIGINLSLDFEKPVFSINGPPGSGKTTLVLSHFLHFFIDFGRKER